MRIRHLPPLALIFALVVSLAPARADGPHDVTTTGTFKFQVTDTLGHETSLNTATMTISVTSDGGPIAGKDGHFFAAINIAFFEDVAEVKARTDAIIRQVHDSKRRPDVSRLYVPGEIEADFAASRGGGISLAGPTVDDIAAEASRLGVDASALFEAPAKN